ncbi:ATP-binding protein [Rhodocaloribacter sp.]
MRVSCHKVVCLLGLGFLAVGAGYAQKPALDPARALTQYVHESWQDEDELPQLSVTSIVQTRDGYLWLGTQEGLARFNGTAFLTFDKGNTEAFSKSHNIRALLEDRSGTLWIGVIGDGLVRYRDGVFRRDSLVAATRISALAGDREGAVWVGSFGEGLYRIADGRAMRFGAKEGLPTDFITALHADREGRLWIGARDGLFRLDGAGFTAFTGAEGLSDPYIESIHEDASGTLWVGTRAGLDQIRDGRVVRQPFPEALGGDVVAAITEDAAGSLWFGMRKEGVVRYRSGRFDAFGREDGLTNAGVRAFFIDREGSLWIGTDGGGLNRLRESKFVSFGTPENLSNDFVYSVYEDAEGAMWVGTEGGVNRIADGSVTTLTTRDGLSHDVVSSVYGDGRGTLWFGTMGWGLNRYADGRFTHYTTKDGLAHNFVSSLFDNGRGTLWVGTDGGVSRFREGRFENITTEEGLSGNYVTALLEDRAGVLWVGTFDGGLNRIEDGVITHFTEADGLGSNTVLSFYEDGEGVLWIGTYRGGLSRLKDGRFTTFTVQDGLYNDSIYRILEDEQGRFWMSSNRGIFRVDRQALTAYAEGAAEAVRSVVYTRGDGLRSREMNGGVQPAGWKSRDGRLWFPSVNGVAMIDPAHIRRNEIPPPVVIEEVVAGGGERLPPHAFAELSPGQDRIEFQFAGLSFVAPEEVTYKYRLDGYDETWSGPTSRHTATYTNLDPGRYTFHVLARNGDGVWSTTEAAFSFYLKPFFYQTTWFYVLCFLGLIGLVVAGHRVRVNRLKARQRELEHLVDARTQDLRTAKDQIEAQANKLRDLDRFKSRFFANISHEFRTPLTLMVGPLENALYGSYGALPEPLKNQMQIMLRNALRLLRLINQLLDLSKLESGKMHLKTRPRNLVELIEGIVFSFTAFAEQKGIALAFTTTSEQIELYYEPDKLEKVFFNLLSNAVKFTPSGGTIRVSVTELPPDAGAPDGCVEVRVQDTGIGIPAEHLPYVFDRFRQVDDSNTREHEGTGIGLALARELVLLHGGDIDVESTPGEGTTFTVRLLRGKRHLKKEEIVEEDFDETAEPVTRGLIEMASADFNYMQRSDLGPSEVRDETPALEEAPLVLVVDDNADIRKYVASCLEGRYRVAEARDGQAGLKQALTLRPDLIITDLMMPKLDGLGLSEAVKGNEDIRHIPIILLTAKTSQEVIIEGLEHGADDYVSKPFNARELVARIDNLIRLRRQEAELRVFYEDLERIVQEQLKTILVERERYEAELIEARDRAEESARLKTAILTNMSHEIRTPLAAILGYAQILSGEVGEQQQEFVDFIEQNGRRLMSTLNAILDLSRLEAEDLAVSRQPVNVVAAALHTVALFKPMARKKGLTLRAEGARPEAVAHVDRAAVDRILNNLVGNAIKFTDEGEVVITVEMDRKWVRLSVEDTGVGIGEAFLPKLFEAFKQESSGLSRSHNGSGLGLDITRRLVQIMDGRIEVTSEKGKGTRFTVWLPRFTETDDDAPDTAKTPVRDVSARETPPRAPKDREPREARTEARRTQPGQAVPRKR